MFAIYQVTNQVNGKSYIGFTTKKPEERWKRHCMSSNQDSETHFHRSIRKHGANNFKFEILEEGWDPKIGLDTREPYWISVLKPEYNMTHGGDGVLGYSHGRVTRKKMGDAQKKRFEDSSERDKLTVRSMGKHYALGCKHPHDMNTKSKISIGMRGKKNAQGAKHSAEMNQEKSVRQKGVGVGISQPRISCPYCQKDGSISNMKRWHFDNCKRKI